MSNMKKFEYWDYYTSCPLAVAIENAINTCGSLKEHLAKIKEIFKGDEFRMDLFFNACMAYWGTTEYYDGRNQYAVFTCREIVKEFPETLSACDLYDEEILLNAYGFTMSAHRYLQNELFKTIYDYMKDNDSDIYKWLEEKEFVYNEDNTGLVPYKEYRRARYGF